MIMNTSKEKDTKNDYIILCSQRSGSHLLATLLNSHSDISCSGESGEKMDELKYIKDNINGRIVMYNRTKNLEQLDNVKILHLVRNPYDTARSRWVNSLQSKDAKHDVFESHYREDKEFNITIDEKEIKKLSSNINKEQSKFRNLIKNKPHREINYDEITRGECISKLDEETTTKILNFLEVKDHHPLVTKLKKPKWNFKNIN